MYKVKWISSMHDSNVEDALNAERGYELKQFVELSSGGALLILREISGNISPHEVHDYDAGYEDGWNDAVDDHPPWDSDEIEPGCR